MSISVQVAIATLLTSYTYFFFDDFMFMQQARTDGFGLAYLRAPLFEHFSPITRVVDKFVVDAAPGSFALAHGIQLVIYAGAIVSMAFVLRAILGRTWLALALTTLFGQSVFLLRLLNWFTATVNLMPATAFTLLAIGCYLQWTRGRRRSWLVASMIAFAGGLCDYETAMLFPLFLVLIRLLVLGEGLDPRSWVRELWSERWAWGGYLVLEVAALINYYQNYYTAQPRPSVGELIHFLEISLLQVFIPGLFGIARIVTPGTGFAVAADLLFLVALGMLLYLRPRAWRSMLVALLAFLVSMVALALNRITTYGIYSGAELYYQQSAQLMLFVMLGFGLSRRSGGVRTTRPGSLLGRVPARAVVVVGVVAAAGYGALYVTSVDALANKSWQPHISKPYLADFKRSVAQLTASTGREPNLIDLTVPATLMQANFAPFNMYSFFFPVIDDHLRYDEANGPAYVVSLSGSLVPVHFAGLAAARIAGGSECVPPGAARPVRIPLPGPIRLGQAHNGLPYAIEVRFRLPAESNVPVSVAPAGSGKPTLIGYDTHFWGPGSGTGLALVRTEATAAAVVLELPGRSCVSAVSVGRIVSGKS